MALPTLIRPATPDDVPAICKFIADLAVYERLSEDVVVTEADLGRDLFGPAPRVFAEIAEWDGRPAGYALWFYTYSSFRGRHGIWLEDLFVCPDLRGKGIGKALLLSLARRCVAEGLGRFEWAVLNWNKPSIAFYEARGAKMLEGWGYCRVEGDALQRLGSA